MVSEEPTDGRCNAPAGEDNAYFCEAYPYKDENGDPRNGRCAIHGGKNPGAPKGNQNAAGSHDLDQDGNTNALNHGAYSARSPGELYPALDPGDREFVDTLTRKYIEFGGWDPDDPRVTQLIDICVDIWRRARAKGILVENGPSQETVIGTDAQTGEPIWGDEEHHLQRPVSSIDSDIRQGLKDLNLNLPPEDAATNSIEAGGLTVNFNIERVPDETDYVDVESEPVED